MTQTLSVLVPKPNTNAAACIDPGSGIVTDERAVEHALLVYFEGNRFGAENLRTHAERVQCAAGRLTERYPTIARGLFPREEFVVVGTWTAGTVTVTDPDTLAAWLA